MAAGSLGTGRWWAFVVRGAAAILFGILTFAWPGMALLTLVLLFGAYALVEGAANLAGALRGGDRERSRWVLALEGVASLLAGLIAFFIPGLTAVALLYVVAAWSLLTGALELAAAVRLRRVIRGEWLLALSGVLSIAFGVLLLAFPRAGALALVLWIGAYAIVFGATLVALGVRLRRATRGSGHGPGIGELAPTRA